MVSAVLESPERETKNYLKCTNYSICVCAMYGFVYAPESGYVLGLKCANVCKLAL